MSEEAQSTQATQASRYARWQADLRERRRSWLVTGAAGFIGSHLDEMRLVAAGADGRRGLDNFVTGHREANLDDVQLGIGSEAAELLEFVAGDIRDPATRARAVCRGVDVVLHQAALGSVPRSRSSIPARDRWQ